MTKIYWQKNTVLQRFGIKESTLKKLVSLGAPQAIPFKGYPIEELCRWIVARPQQKSDKTKTRERAQAFLYELIDRKKEKQPGNPAKSKNEKSPAAPRKKKADLTPGLSAALERARLAEVDAYEAHHESMQKTGIISAGSLDAWQKTLDILRKCETDFTKVLERRRELVEIKQVQDWLQHHIEQIKAILLNLPAKLAPSLESLPWHEIQKRLDQEVRDAISKLSEFK